MPKDLTDDAVELKSPTVKTDKASKPSEESPAADLVHADTPPILTRLARFVARNYNNFFTKVPWAIAIFVILAILIQGLFEHVTVIQSISVPPALANTGYTPEVAGNRLRDAIADFVKSANSHMKSPDVALQGDLPNIVVPTVGISLDAVLASLRTLLRSTRSRTIAGEFTIVGNQLWLRLRIDGRPLFSNDKGGDPNNPDALLKVAAQSVIHEIQPYYVPASMSTSNPSEALALINSIIGQFPKTDSNVIWAYNLKGSILTNRKDLTDKNDYSAAKEALTTALQGDPRLAAAYINMGNILRKENDEKGALADYNKAIKIEPTYAFAHRVLGGYYQELKRLNDAIAEYRNAIKYDFNNSEYHFDLAYALSIADRSDDEDTIDEVIDEYRQAIRIKPSYSMAHYNLGIELRKLGKDSESIAEYQEAIKDAPQFALPHNNLGRALHDAKKDREAIVEYRAAIKIDPNEILAHNNLGIALSDLGMKKDAIAEFQTVLKIDSNNATALDHLQELVDTPKRGK